MSLLTLTDLHRRMSSDPEFEKEHMLDYKLKFKPSETTKWPAEEHLDQNVRTTQLAALSCRCGDTEHSLKIHLNHVVDIQKMKQREIEKLKEMREKSFSEQASFGVFGAQRRKRFYSEDVS